MKSLGILLLLVLGAYGYYRYTQNQHRHELVAAHTFAIGSTEEDVIEAKGTPPGRASDGHSTTFSYPDVIINFTDGLVVESHAPALPATPPSLYRPAAPQTASGSWMWDKNHHSALDAPSPKPGKGGAHLPLSGQ